MMPEWFEEWVVCEMDNWHLKPGAPEHVQRDLWNGCRPGKTLKNMEILGFGT